MTNCHAPRRPNDWNLMKYDKNSLSPGGVEVNIMPVVQGDSLVHFDPDQLPEVVPVLALRNAVLFPGRCTR